jgi:inorganic pyrophosphatase/manganese-dependent inorganic pyrophosphatase
MKVITSGSTYLDIDGYGAMVAYAELLNLQGALAVANAQFTDNTAKVGKLWLRKEIIKTDQVA